MHSKELIAFIQVGKSFICLQFLFIPWTSVESWSCRKHITESIHLPCIVVMDSCRCLEAFRRLCLKWDSNTSLAWPLLSYWISYNDWNSSPPQHSVKDSSAFTAILLQRWKAKINLPKWHKKTSPKQERLSPHLLYYRLQT